MRLLYVVPAAAGGIRNHLVELVKHFSKKYEVAVVSPPDGRLEKAVLEGGGAFYGSSGSFGAQLLSIRRLLKSFKPCLLHLHGYKAELTGRLSALGTGIPMVATLHNYLVYPGSNILPARLFYLAEKYLPGPVSIYIAVSEALREDFLKRSGTGQEKVMAIYNGICTEPFERAQPLKGFKSLGSPLIGATLRLTRQKGVDILVEAAPAIFARHPGAAILICGQGPLEGELRRRVHRMGLGGRVLLLGFMDDLPSFLASLDIFVQPSRTEGLGITVLEALACGTPVVATQVGGIPDIITSGVHGLLVPPRDPPGLAAAVSRLLEDAELGKTLAKRGKKRIKERFLLQDMLEKTAGVYEGLLQEKDWV